MDHSMAVSVASGFVSSRFDYANSVYVICCPQKQIGLARLQRAQHALARVVTQQSSRSSSLTSTKTSQTASLAAHRMANQVQPCLLQSITHPVIRHTVHRRSFTVTQAQVHEVHALICQSLTFSSTAQPFI